MEQVLVVDPPEEIVFVGELEPTSGHSIRKSYVVYDLHCDTQGQNLSPTSLSDRTVARVYVSQCVQLQEDVGAILCRLRYRISSSERFHKERRLLAVLI